jgi:hypothetical protein
MARDVLGDARILDSRQGQQARRASGGARAGRGFGRLVGRKGVGQADGLRQRQPVRAAVIERIADMRRIMAGARAAPIIAPPKF